MSVELKPCPQCGSIAQVDCTGTLECYGWDWQTLYVGCTGNLNEKCGMELSLHADFFYVDYRTAENTLVALWNTLATKPEPAA